MDAEDKLPGVSDDVAPEDAEPVDTDNGVREEDGEQDVSQDATPVEGSPTGDDE